jgi:23S rRNA pseudouridine1911/1915/1917 synthase
MVQPKNLLDDIDSAAVAIDGDALQFILDQDHAGQRLDKVLALLIPDHSRARIQGWIEAGHVQVNGVLSTRQTQVVGCGDEVLVQVQPSDQALAFEPEDIAFHVIDESDHWLVVDKQAGLVVHPGAGNWRGTLLNGLLYRYPELGGVARAGIVHRLDKDTTGLMVVAKTQTAQTHLVRQLQDRSVKRLYRALAHGWLDTDQLTVDRAIGRDPRVPVRMSVSPSGSSKPAITHVTKLCSGKLQGLPVSLISCRLETGRTHQIRVHLASLNHPLIGDVLYGGKTPAGVTRQMLHAESLSFMDPATEQWVGFESPLPADLQSVASQIDWSEGTP